MSVFFRNMDHGLTADEQAEHGHYEDLLSFWENLLGSGRTVMQLGPTHIDTLEAIADTSDAVAGAIAKGILNSLYGYNYQVVPLGTGGQQQGLMAPPIGDYAETQGAASLISAFPNPARQQVTFSWNLPKGSDEGLLRVTDLKGTGVLEKSLEGSSGKLKWDTGFLESGIYFYQLVFDRSASAQLKIVLIK